MIKNILKELGGIDEKVMKVINKGLMVSFFIALMGILLLLTYNTYSVNYDFFEGGFILVKTGLAFGAQFIGCGLGINQIIKEKM